MVVSFHDLARVELNEAADYYERETPGLGLTFVTEVERCAESIVQYPSGGVVILGSIRRRLVRRFPYALLYTLKPDRVRVLAIMNLKRRPAYWVGRS